MSLLKQPKTRKKSTAPEATVPIPQVEDDEYTYDDDSEETKVETKRRKPPKPAEEIQINTKAVKPRPPKTTKQLQTLEKARQVRQAEAQKKKEIEDKLYKARLEKEKRILEKNITKKVRKEMRDQQYAQMQSEIEKLAESDVEPVPQPIPPRKQPIVWSAEQWRQYQASLGF